MLTKRLRMPTSVNNFQRKFHYFQPDIIVCEIPRDIEAMEREILYNFLIWSGKPLSIKSSPGGGGVLGYVLSMCRWPLRTPTPL